MSQLSVGILRGGPGEQFKISLESGSALLEVLADKREYLPLDIFVDKEGTWHRNGIPYAPEKILRSVDVVITTIAGEVGETGKLQRILEHNGTPFVGSKSFECNQCLNKAHVKELLEQHGIKSPNGRVLSVHVDLGSELYEIFRSFPQPLVVKPLTGGASVGVSVVYGYHAFLQAVQNAFDVSHKVLIEEYIRGKEATCGVLDNFRGKQHYALLPVEIVHEPGKQYYDFESKCSPCNASCPGTFSEREKRQMEQYAEKVHELLGLRHYSRSDFLVTPKGVFFLEVNPIPELSKGSTFVKGLEGVGSNLEYFLKHSISMAQHS